MSRIIWKGAISFGLVHVPVQLFPATQSDRIGFNLLDKRTIDPIGYRQINKRTGKEVARDDIVRGYEYEKGKYVVLSDEEIRAANPEATQTVEILAFVDASELSFMYLDTPYYLVPDRKGEKVYTLLREAMKSSGKIGIAKLVMHNKQHLAALIAAGPALMLDTLRRADEVRSPDELKLPDEGARAEGITARELDMAKKLIDDMSTAWDPAAYPDTFHDDILALVDKKIRAGKTEEIDVQSVRTSKPRSAEILDLSDLLRRSLGRGRGKVDQRPANDDSHDKDENADDESRPAAPARKSAPRRRRAAG
jgi:DNA end-binding protein Ku